MLSYTAERFRYYVKQVRRFVLYRLLHVSDPPHQLAMGVAVGVFVAFTPTIGFQMVINVFLAWLLRANKAVGVPIVWVSNPVTFVPIYYPLYLLGTVLTGSESVGKAWFENVINPEPEIVGWWPNVKHVWGAIMDVAVPLWVGCLVFAIGLAVPAYFVCLTTIRAYRMRKWGALVPPEPPKPEKPHKPGKDDGDDGSAPETEG